MNSDSVCPAPSVTPIDLASCLTPHAAARVQQRGIDLCVLDCLIRYGRREHDHHRCEVVVFDEASLARVARHEPHALWRRSVEARSLYAVTNSEGDIVTAGHRFRRVQRDRSISSYRPNRSRRPRVLHGPNRRES
jgi:hypothetical protein